MLLEEVYWEYQDKRLFDIKEIYNSGYKDIAYETVLLNLIRLSESYNTIYKLKMGTAHEKFSKMLINLTENEFFEKISTKHLLDNFYNLEESVKKSCLPRPKKKYKQLVYILKSYLKKINCNLANEPLSNSNDNTHIICGARTIQCICKRLLTPQELLRIYTEQNKNSEEIKHLKENLWQGSVASQIYIYARCKTAHEYHLKILVNGRYIDFDFLYEAYKNIYKRIKSECRNRNISLQGVDFNELSVLNKNLENIVHEESAL